MEDVGIFYGHFINFMALWYISRPFCQFYGPLVYFMAILSIYGHLVYFTAILSILWPSGIFYGHSVNLRPFSIFHGHSVNFMALWYILWPFCQFTAI
jgi:hypothetical protein